MNTPSVLRKIIATKQAEVAQRRMSTPLETLEKKIETLSAPRDFYAALERRVNQQQPAVIAEFKRASPSAGWINQHADPAEVAAAYQRAGAACMSVLTDAEYFRGSEQDLKRARAACDLPVIRKDFIIDEYQVYETRALGADAMLLIVAALDDNQLQALGALASELNLAVLIEVHDRNELDRALAVPGKLLGINNRDLHQFETRLETSVELAGHVSGDRIIVSESGIHRPEDIRQLKTAGIYSFLIGESLMSADRPDIAMSALFDGEIAPNSKKM